jgi:small multidrug resistance family-3 protein
MPVALFFGAAIFGIAGCSLVWMPHAVAYLALAGTGSAGRAFAVHGGIYIAASVSLMVSVEKVRPDPWGLAGVVICLIGGAVIIFGPRAAYERRKAAFNRAS